MDSTTSYHAKMLASAKLKTSLATHWLLALPNQGMDLTMDQLQYRTALKFFLHMPLRDADNPCQYCPEISDRYGFHSLVCKGANNGKHARHESVAGSVNRIALGAGFSSQQNAKVSCLGFSQGSSHLLRPADILLNEGTGKCTCIDVTVPSPLCKSYASVPLGVLAEKKAVEKINKHADACEMAGYEFSPFVIDVCGVLDQRAWDLLNRLAEAYAVKVGLAKSHSMSCVRRVVSFGLFRGIAAQLCSVVHSAQLEKPALHW